MSLNNTNPLYDVLIFSFAAQCLYAVSDNNPALNVAMEKPEIRGVIESISAQQHTSPKHLLLRTLAAGELVVSIVLKMDPWR